MSSVSSSNSSDAGMATYYRNALRELEADTEKENRRLKDHQESEIERLDGNYQKSLRSQQEEAQKVVENERAMASKQYDREQERFKTAADQLREATYKSNGRLSTSVPLEDHKKEIQAVLDSSDQRHFKETKNSEDREEQLLQQMHENQTVHEDKLRKIQESQGEELKNIREQAREMALQNAQDSKANKNAVSDQSMDLENQHRALIRKINEAHTGEVESLNEQLEHQKAYNQAKSTEMLHDKDSYFTNIIQNKTQDAREREKEVKNSFIQQIDEMKKKEQKSEERSNQAIADHVKKAEELRAKGLTEQSDNYTAALANLKETYEGKLERLKESQKHSLDRDGVPQLSVAAEAAVRKSLIKEYANNFNAEVERNRNAAEQSQRKFSDSYEKLRSNAEDRETRTLQTNEKEKSEDRFQFFSTVDEIQNQAATRVRDQRQEHDKEIENLYRQFGRVMEKQKRDNEYVLNVARNEAGSKITALRQEMQVSTKEAARALSERQNELIREYEKKLTEQKSDYENRIDELKNQNLRDLRDLDRQAKQDMEAQAKGYEQRLQQGEAQSRERERTSIQNYQNELDRTRRSYELLSQKKS